MSKFRYGSAFCILLSVMFISLPARAVNYQDWWWDSSKSGMGVSIGHQGDTLFTSWYLYDMGGNGMWVVLSGVLQNNALSGNLTEYTGPSLGTTFNPALVLGTIVGSATLTFTDAHHATLNYTVSGVSGTLNLTRFSFKNLPIAGKYVGAELRVTRDCTDPSKNGLIFVNPIAIEFTVNGGSLSAIIHNGRCTATGTFTQFGTSLSASGIASCTDGSTRPFTLTEAHVMDDTATVVLILGHNTITSSTSGITCVETATNALTRVPESYDFTDFLN